MALFGLPLGILFAEWIIVKIFVSLLKFLFFLLILNLYWDWIFLVLGIASYWFYILISISLCYAVFRQGYTGRMVRLREHFYGWCCRTSLKWSSNLICWCFKHPPSALIKEIRKNLHLQRCWETCNDQISNFYRLSFCFNKRLAITG